MTSADLLKYQAKAEAELRTNILPFWMDRAVDRVNGGFVGEITHDLKVLPGVERGSLLTSRILWMFSSAFRHYGEARYLETAHWAFDDLIKRFWDQEFGGLYWSVDGQGKPLRTRKQVYGLAFGIYALSEYYRVTKKQEALDKAVALFQLIETHCTDRENGGYWEACSREWKMMEDHRLSEVDLNEPKSQNTHLHIMEGYTNLLRVWPDAALKKAQTALLGVMLDKILDAKAHHLGLFFDAQWNSRTDRISFGHDIEAAWLLTEAAEVLGDETLLARIRQEAVSIAEVTLAESIDSDGAILYEGVPGKGVTVDIKEWWPQAEAVVGFLNAYQLSGDKRFLKTALGLWDFIEAHLVDRKDGEWHRFVTRDRKVGAAQSKVSFWKCPYHNGRTCLEMAERLKALAAKG